MKISRIYGDVIKWDIKLLFGGGAGGFGRYVYAQLRERKDIDIRCFVDSNPNIVGKKVDGISISAPEQLYFDN